MAKGMAKWLWRKAAWRRKAVSNGINGDESVKENRRRKKNEA